MIHWTDALSLMAQAREVNRILSREITSISAQAGEGTDLVVWNLHDARYRINRQLEGLDLPVIG